MRTVPHGRAAAEAAGVTKPPPPARPPLRTRAEQIADELAAAHQNPEPTVRRLPLYEPPVKPRIPGR